MALTSKDFLQTIPILGYGVLGTQLGPEGMKQVEAAPDEKTAFVDPAGLSYIQEMGPADAAGASGAIYGHIGINEEVTFPDDVKKAITEEGLSKYHLYKSGKTSHHVIHTVGPMLVDVTRDEAVEMLAKAYKNVLQEFLAASSSSSITALRLLPISGGIFAGDFIDEMPQLTMEALSSGFSSLSPAQQQKLCAKATQVGLCIFMESDLQAFLDAKAAATNKKA